MLCYFSLHLYLKCTSSGKIRGDVSAFLQFKFQGFGLDVPLPFVVGDRLFVRRIEAAFSIIGIQ